MHTLDRRGYGADVASAMIDRATTKALEDHEVTRTTCAFLVRETDGTCTLWTEDDFRPAERGVMLELLGVDVDDPLRSKPYAMVFEGPSGELIAIGTSEQGKRLLLEQFHMLHLI